MLQGHDRLHQAHGPGRALGVADHRLDAADGDALRCGAGFGQEGCEGHPLGLIPHRRAGAMRFEESDGRGIHAGLIVGPL